MPICPPTTSVDAHTFLVLSGVGDVIDVRSPLEFAQGHIPSAVNVPLFDDEQRAAVGTMYQHRGTEAAIALGFELVGPRMESLRQACLRHAGDGAARIHCWRGGMRSESVAWLLQRSGYKVYLLQGGYKAYRHEVLGAFERSLRLIVLGGLTGAGKTDTLHALRAQGEQVLDLEGLAHHKGSAFGWLGEKPQPSSEMFENALHAQLERLDLRRRIWIEDESRNIGKVVVPQALHQQMGKARTVFLEATHASRMQRLLRDYTRYNPADIVSAIERLRKRLGDVAVRECVAAVEQGDFETAIGMVLAYYDKRYAYSLNYKDREMMRLPVGDDRPQAVACNLRAWADGAGL